MYFFVNILILVLLFSVTSIYPSTHCSSVVLSIYPLFINPSGHYIFIYPSIHPFIYLHSIQLSFCSSIRPSVCPSIHPSKVHPKFKGLSNQGDDYFLVICPYHSYLNMFESICYWSHMKSFKSIIVFQLLKVNSWEPAKVQPHKYEWLRLYGRANSLIAVAKPK